MSHDRFICLAVLCCIIFVSCSSSRTNSSEFKALKSFGDTRAKTFSDLLERIEGGDLSAWTSFVSYHGNVDGESSFTYSLACGELARRDPTIFLRRHLAGEDRAIAIGKRAYGAVGPEGRRVMEWLHSSRLKLAIENEERAKIQEYIDALNSVLNSIDKKYR